MFSDYVKFEFSDQSSPSDIEKMMYEIRSVAVPFALKMPCLVKNLELKCV